MLQSCAHGKHQDILTWCAVNVLVRVTSYGGACAADVWLFSCVQMEEISNDSCVQLIAFRWLDPLPTLRYQLQTHLTHLQATFECDGTCRRFCCIHVDSLCLCPLRRHEETSTGSPDLCPRTHLVGRRLHLEKTWNVLERVICLPPFNIDTKHASVVIQMSSRWCRPVPANLQC